MLKIIFLPKVYFTPSCIFVFSVLYTLGSFIKVYWRFLKYTDHRNVVLKHFITNMNVISLFNEIVIVKHSTFFTGFNELRNEPIKKTLRRAYFR